MMNEEVLEVSRYPEIVYDGTAVSAAQVTGPLPGRYSRGPVAARCNPQGTVDNTGNAAGRHVAGVGRVFAAPERLRH